MDDHLSPYTGWVRHDWEALADDLLRGAMAHSSADRARIVLPGDCGRQGEAVSGFEGFARTAMLAAFRLQGLEGRDPLNLADFYAAGIIAGTNPDNPNRWPTPAEKRQAVVEACSIVLFLDATRTHVWQTWAPETQRQVVAWLQQVRTVEIPDNNWIWFVIMVETFLRSVRADWNPDLVQSCLARHEQRHAGDGWFRDGDLRRFDYYTGWAWNFLPHLWLKQAGAAGLEQHRRELYGEWLGEYVRDAVHLISADGSPVVQGRSLIYRWAVAAPFWAAGEADIDALEPGLVRRTCSGIVRHFVERDAVTDDATLTRGWYEEWPGMAQWYSTPGSPYWAVKGMYGLALPATHNVWQAVEEPLPVERGDFVRALPAPGWLVTGTKVHGLIRVVNHGTDASETGRWSTDQPLYARLGYSSATFPPLQGAWVNDPFDNSVAIVTAQGRASHRSGFERLGITTSGDVVTAASRWRAHWVDDPQGEPDFESCTGHVTLGPEITVTSVVRAGGEVRIVRVRPLPDDAQTGRLRVGGWAVPVGAGLASTLEGLHRLPEGQIGMQPEVTPLAEQTKAPARLSADDADGSYVAFVALHRVGVFLQPPEVKLSVARASITWGDGRTWQGDI